MKNKICLYLFFILFFLSLEILAQQSSLSTTFTYHTKQSNLDKRFDYDFKLLKLALEKTVKKYGPYELVPLKISANYKRIESISLKGEIPNLIYKHSVSDERVNKFGYVPFPVDRGIVGYRVAFISKHNKEKLKNVNSLSDLKKFIMLQGLGWLDIRILKHNGFEVEVGDSYSGLFSMVAKNRGDLFLRGANELYDEWISHKNIKNLDYDESLVIYYPLPRFFFTNKKNKEAIKRVHEGLILAYHDGSLNKLWESHYLRNINFSNLKKRKMFILENPFLNNIDKNYEQYIYKP